MSTDIICSFCWKRFELHTYVKKFIDKISPVFNWKKYSIPLPDICPKCSLQQKMSFRNEIKLYKKKCDWTWKIIVSMIHPDSEYKCFDSKYWHSDKWDPMIFWIDIEYNNWFFEQYYELDKMIPKLNLIQLFNNDNSDYCNYVWWMKNCFLEHWWYEVSNSLYGYENCFSDKLIDCAYMMNSTICYESTNSVNVHKWFFVHESENIYDSKFIFNCKNLENCIFCVNLQNKKYCINNKQYTEGEYNEISKKFNLSSFTNIDKLKKEFYKFTRKFPQKNLNISNYENSIWDNIRNSNNAYLSFNILGDCSDVYYCYKSTDLSDCIDVLNSWLSVSKCYNWYNLLDWVSNCFFSLHIVNSRNIFYSSYLTNCSDCFWCIWINNKQYCILNKQYSKKEYEKIVPNIINMMIKNNERWKFFPKYLSPFWYNETIAINYFPLNKEKATKNWYKWQEKEYHINIPNWLLNIESDSLEDNISDIEENITEKAIICKKSSKPFRITKIELWFYKEYNIALPRIHPDERLIEKFEKFRRFELFDVQCYSCKKSIKTSHDPSNNNIIKCNSCYYRTL